MELSNLLTLLGDPGRYQSLLALCLWLCSPLVAMNHIIMGIYGSSTKHSCKLPFGVDKNGSVPYKIVDNERVYSSCMVFKGFNSSNKLKIPCPDGWDYFFGDDGTTIVSEWDLVCDRKYLVSLSTSLYFTGVMIGGLVFGILSDKYGRRLIVLGTLYTSLVLGIILSQAPSYVSFVIIRILIGFLLQGLQSTGYILLIETISPNYRTSYGVAFPTCWGLGTLWVSAIAYTLRDWRSIQLAICIPSVVTIAYFWIVPESMRWLLVHDKRKEMTVIAHRFLHRNGIRLKDNIDDLINTTTIKKDQENVSIIDMMKSKVLRKRAIIMFIIWMAAAIGYYGLALNAGRLQGDKYLNFLISGCVELPAGIMCIYVLKRFGRRLPLAIFLILGGITCIISGTIPYDSSVGRLIKFIFATVGKYFVSSAFATIMLIGAELFPTSVRNSAIGACFFCARLGGIAAPQLLLLGEYTFKQLPILVIGGVQTGSGLLALLLPETKDVQLLDTINQLNADIDEKSPEEQHILT